MPPTSKKRATIRPEMPLEEWDSQLFPFVITTPSQKGIQNHSRRVRSFVARKRLRHNTGWALPSWIAQEAGNRPTQEQNQTLPESLGPFSIVNTPSHLPHGVQPSMLQEAFRFLAYAEDLFYPPSLCLPNSSNDGGWGRYLVSDEVLLHSLLSGSQALADLLSCSGRSQRTERYHLKALKFLQDRIATNDEPLAISDPTIMTIVSLALASEIFLSDYSSAESHLFGLQRMVMLRGGLQSLNSAQDQLSAKICRLDLDIAMQSGRCPIFPIQSLFWEPYLSHRKRDQPEASGNKITATEFVESLDSRIAILWRDFRQFCQTCNLSSQTGYKLHRHTYSGVLISMLYRLLHLSSEYDARSEALRLGMVALASKLFLPWKDKKQDFQHLEICLRNAIQKLQVLGHNNSKVPNSILFWLVIQWCTVQSSEVKRNQLEDLFGGLISRLCFDSWLEARELLKSVLWVDILNDSEGKAVFDRVWLKM